MRSDTLPETDIKKKKGIFLRWILVLMQLILGGVAMFWVITKGNVSLDQFLNCFTSSSIFPLLLSLLCFAGAMGVVALRNSILIRQKIPFGYYWGLAFFLNTLLTFIPWRIGEIGFPWLMHRDQQVPVKESLIVILIVRAFDMLVIIMVVLLSGNQLLANFYLDFRRLDFVFLITAIFFLITVLLIYIFYNKLRDLMTEFVQLCKEYFQLKTLFYVFVLSLLSFVLTAMQSFFALHAVGLKITILDIIILKAGTIIAALLPIHPPGGWGTIDSIQIFILLQFGFFLDEIASSILAAHTFYTFLIMFGGVFGWMILNRKVRG